jgi:hypothetical protein
MINGFNSIGGTRIEDIIEEFQETYAKENSAEVYKMIKSPDHMNSEVTTKG